MHLLNGDRIAGEVISQTTNELVLSNIWIKQLTIPVAQIHSLEILTNAPGTNVTKILVGTNLFSGTNMVVLVKVKVVNTNTFWRRWKGDAAVGADLERGAADHQLYYGKANLSYAQPYASDPKRFFRNIITFDAAYGKTSGLLSDNRVAGSVKSDFDLTRKWYVYNLGGAFFDEVRLINRHYEDGPGLGFHWFNQTNFAVNLELGANYQVEDRSDGTRTDSAYFRLGQDMMWKLNKQMTLTEKFEYFPRVGYATQFRMRLESTLSYALFWHLAWNLSVVDFYDTAPAAGIPNNDLQVRTSLGVKF
ncbi:MAG TPA: DUF481 domain-containing protein [Verrucomicrobiae bacterium]|nr:DUF481 domain-containing protein [Verrucomicrobiae bacterium]